MDPNAKGSGYYLFGRDIMAIPCLRSSTLTGFGASFGAGILHFLCTSNGVKAFQFAKITFFVVTFPYWFYCREQVYKEQLVIYEAQSRIGEKTDDEYIITDSLEFGTETFG